MVYISETTLLELVTESQMFYFNLVLVSPISRPLVVG